MLSNRLLFVEAYHSLVSQGITPVISSAVYIELQYWLIQERGRSVNSVSRSLFGRSRNWLDKTLVLNIAEADTIAVAVAKQYPDTGLGDSFTIAIGLFYDVEIFTLNPKHFKRIKGLRLYEPANYQELVRNA